MFGSKQKAPKIIYRTIYGGTLFEGKLCEGMSFETNAELTIYDFFIVTLASGMKCLGTFTGANLCFSTISPITQSGSSYATIQPVFIIGSLARTQSALTLEYCNLASLARDTEDIPQESQKKNTTVTRIDGYRRNRGGATTFFGEP